MAKYGYSIEIATVQKVVGQEIKFIIKTSLSENNTFYAPIPYAYAGRGGGFLAGVEEGTKILVAKGPGDTWYCLGFLPHHLFLDDVTGKDDIYTYETEYPNMRPGEVALKSTLGSEVYLDKYGNIRLDAGASCSSGDIELSKNTKTLFIRADNEYTFSEAGRQVYGVIKRDKGAVEEPADTQTINFLDSEHYDELLQPISRHPSNENHILTGKSIKQLVRNPSLVEKREVIYEYANSYNVQDFESEVNALDKSLEDNIAAIQKDPSERQNRRTDILNLNQLNYNHLIEKVEGTLVDVYGNVLDINRNPIPIPDVTDIENNRNDTDKLGRVYDYHRRGVKLHYEINTRKAQHVEPEKKNQDNGKNFSRWSIDVDAEGLTKINIPASSDTGNIPVLARYFNSRDEEDKKSGVYRDKERVDIRMLPFSTQAQTIKNKDYAQKVVDGAASAGTAYHNISQAISSIRGGSLTLTGDTAPVLTAELNNKIGPRGGPDDGANAGGRSVQLNFDGSLEASIGADTADKKSLVLDTQGAAVLHIGKDRNGRSIITQTDGNVLMEIGGSAPVNSDSRFLGESSGAAKLEIHVSKGSGTAHKIIIDEQGLTFDIQGNTMFISSGDMGLYAQGRLLLGGELVFLYGKIEKRNITAFETLMVRAGIPQFM